MPKARLIRHTMWLAVMTAMVGCRDQPDERVERIMQESLARQVEQNQHIAEQSRSSAEAAQRVVEADAAARKEVLQLQRELVERDADGRHQLAELNREVHGRLDQDRQFVDSQRQTLEFERRQIAGERNRDPIIAQTIGTVGTILASTIPLLLAGYVIYTVNRTGSEDRSVSEVLITELTAEHPMFVGRYSPALPFDGSPDRLPASDTDQSPA